MGNPHIPRDFPSYLWIGDNYLWQFGPSFLNTNILKKPLHFLSRYYIGRRGLIIKELAFSHFNP